jgi:hypothetical protein
MTFTKLDEDPGGFLVLRSTFGGDGSGEAHLQVPDGSICHIEWTLLGGVHFQDVPTVEGVEDRGSWSKEEDENLQSFFPDLQAVAEERLARRRDPIYDEIPDLEKQWGAWRASQGR